MKAKNRAVNPQVNLRFEKAIAKALAADAKKTKTTIQAVVIGIVASHYGLEVAAPQRGRPKIVNE